MWNLWYNIEDTTLQFLGQSVSLFCILWTALPWVSTMPRIRRQGQQLKFWHLCSAAPHWYTLVVCFWLRETCLCTGTWQQPDMGALDFCSLKVNSQQTPQWLKERCFSGHKNILLSSGTLAISFSFKIYTVSQDPRSGRCYTTL